MLVFVFVISVCVCVCVPRHSLVVLRQIQIQIQILSGSTQASPWSRFSTDSTSCPTTQGGLSTNLSNLARIFSIIFLYCLLLQLLLSVSLAKIEKDAMENVRDYNEANIVESDKKEKMTSKI